MLIAQEREPRFGHLQRHVTLLVILPLGTQGVALPSQLRSFSLQLSPGRLDLCLSRLQVRSLRFELSGIRRELAA